MSKSYYQNNQCIIPFTKVSSVHIPYPTERECIKVFVNDKSYGMEDTAKADFLTQYTAWLDLQSTPQL